MSFDSQLYLAAYRNGLELVLTVRGTHCEPTLHHRFGYAKALYVFKRIQTNNQARYTRWDFLNKNTYQQATVVNFDMQRIRVGAPSGEKSASILCFALTLNHRHRYATLFLPGCLSAYRLLRFKNWCAACFFRESSSFLNPFSCLPSRSC